MLRSVTTVLSLALLSGVAFAQQPVDPTLQDTPHVTVSALQGGGSRATSECDDFDRANGLMGGDWTQISGQQMIVNNMGQSSGGGNAWMSHNNGNDDYKTAVVEFDLYSAGGLNYVAMVTGGNDGVNQLYTKLQSNAGGNFDYIGFYTGFNGPSYGTGFTAITPVSGGHITMYCSNNGDTMNVDIDEDFDGVVDYTYASSGILGMGLNLTQGGVGIGTYGYGTYDNWSLNGGCGGGGPALSVANLVAGGVATISVTGATPGGLIRHGYSLFGAGPTTTPYGDLLLTPPYTELPSMIADGVGDASMASPVPPGTTGIQVWLHAMDMGSLTFTNGVATIIG